MATFVRSALNPSGTWQQDGLDQIELANRQFGAHQAAQDRASQLALAQLQSQDARFGAERNDRMNMFNTGRQDQMNQFAAQADLTKAGWDRADSRHSSDLEAQLAIAKLQREPGELERKKFDADQAERAALMNLLGIGGQPAAAPTQFQTPSDMMGFGGAPKSAQAQGPAGAGAVMPSGGFGGLDQNKLQAISAYQALRNGGSMPNFGAQAAQNELTQLSLEKARRDARNEATADANPVTPEAISAIIAQKLPGFVDKDTESAWSRGLKGVTGGATAGAVGGAGVGSFFGGVGAIPGAIGGAIAGGLGGGLGGALSTPNDPGADESQSLVELYHQLVQAYKIQNRGNEALAKQQALAEMQRIAQSSGQKGDYLTDWDADKTRSLFEQFK